MRMYEISGDNRFDTWTEHRVACRGIVVSGEKVLLCYEKVTDQYGIPGGGAEGLEAMEECCRREIAEETGVTVCPEEEFLIMNEYYEEWFFETHYFACRVTGESERKLTAREQRVGMVPVWLPIRDAVAIFARHREYADTDEEKRGIYLREYTALQTYTEQYADRKDG